MLMNETQVQHVYHFLTAYESSVVRAALKRLALTRRSSEGTKPDADTRSWSLWTGEGLPGKGYEWTEINGRILYRKAQPQPRQTTYDHAPAQPKPRRTDTGVSPVPLIGCPDCGAGMYKEGVCPACEDGKKGYRIRLLCGECDRTILL